MNRPAGVTAEELVKALKRRRAALPAEIGSFVVLEACEALLVRGPELLALDSIHISEEGSVWLPPGTRCPENDAAVALHRLLTTILVAAGPAPPPALMRLLEKGPTGGSWTLAGLRDDLEASLVPLNRGASRRVLARFVREIGWAERAPDKKPTFGELDSELSSLLGVEQPRPPIPSLRERLRDAEILQSEPPPEPPQEELDDVRFFESVRPVKPPAAKTLVDAAPPQDLRPARDLPQERHPSMRPAPSNAPSRPPGRDSTFDLGAPRKRALWAGAALVLLSVLVLVVTFRLRPDLETRLSKPPASAEQAGEARPKVVVKRPPGGDLVVRVATERAQILRLVGRGPVSVPHLPLGVAHEFVAVTEGFAPARLLIPPNAEWETTPDGRRFEAAMQLGKAAGVEDGLELGETLLPQDVGSPSSTLGTVRVVTTPRGAKVYQVIGFAPEALVEQLPLEASQEILVYRKGYAPELRVIGPSDYAEAGGRKRAELEVTLSPLQKK